MPSSQDHALHTTAAKATGHEDSVCMAQASPGLLVGLRVFLLALLLQLCLATLAFAAPLAQEVSTSTVNNSWQYGTGGGVIGFIVLVLDIIVFSTSSTTLCLPALSSHHKFNVTGMLTTTSNHNSRGPEI